MSTRTIKSFFLQLFLLTALFSISSEAQNTGDKSLGISSAMISVTVGGDFPITGTFPAMINERVDQFVTRISSEALKSEAVKAVDLLKKNDDKRKDKIPLRNIILRRHNSPPLTLDLQKFRMEGDFKNNPYLQNDDILIFPVLDLDRDFFSTEGAVNKPGKYQFIEGDKLSDAIYYSYGISKAYDNVTKAEVYRLSQDGLKLEKLVVSVNDDFPLKRGDRIRIGTEETYRKDYKLLVLGEVRFPGYIPVSRNSATVADIIKAAGGLTERADQANTRIYRSGNVPPGYFERLYGISSNEEADLQKLAEANAFNSYVSQYTQLELSRMSGMTEVDTAYFFNEVRLRKMLDYERVELKDYESPASFASQKLLNMGDIVFVGAKETSVSLFGQVRMPGNYKYVEGKDFRYYIDAAGGLGEYAIDDEIWLIKRFGNEWINVTEEPAKIEAGDMLYIQRKNLYSFGYYVGMTGGYFSILGSIATVVLLFVQFGK